MGALMAKIMAPGPNFRMIFFKEKTSILTSKISDDRFYSLEENSLFQNIRFLHDTFFSNSYFATHPTTLAYLSKYWGTDAWAVSPILGDRLGEPPETHSAQ